MEDAPEKIQALERKVKLLHRLVTLVGVAGVILSVAVWRSGKAAGRARSKLAVKEVEVAEWAVIENALRNRPPPQDVIDNAPPDYVSEEAKDLVKEAKAIVITQYEDLGSEWRPVIKEILWVAPGTIFDYVVGEELGHRIKKEPDFSVSGLEAGRFFDAESGKPIELKLDPRISENPLLRRIIRHGTTGDGGVVICDGKPGEPAEIKQIMMIYGDRIPSQSMNLDKFRELVARWKMEQENPKAPGAPEP